MMTLTLDTEDLEDLAAGQLPKGHGGQLAQLRHQRPTANVPLRMIGPIGAGSAAQHDLAPQVQHRMSPLLQNQRGRRQMKVASVHTQTDILRRVQGLPGTLPPPSNPASSLPNKLVGGRRASFGITP